MNAITSPTSTPAAFIAPSRPTAGTASLHRTPKAPWNEHRTSWRAAYRQLRLVRGRAVHWLHRAARAPHNHVCDPWTLARAVLTTVRDGAWCIATMRDNPMMIVRTFRSSAGEADKNTVFALHVSEDTPRPIPLRTVAWALGALAWWIIEERYALKTAGEVRVDEVRSETFMHVYRAVPTMREADRRPKGTAWGWQAERMLCRMIADKVLELYEQHWPVEFAANVRRDLIAEARAKLGVR